MIFSTDLWHYIMMKLLDPNFSWIYLVIFLAIPLARIIPRLLAKKRMQNAQPQNIQNFEKIPQSDYTEKSQTEPIDKQADSRPQTDSMIVLGKLNQGYKTFEQIQKNTGLQSEALETILNELEDDGMLKVVQKQGLLGLKTELYPTDKGFKAYYT